jgi:ferredoxin
MASGVMMSWLDHDQVQGHQFQAHAHAAHDWPANARSPASFLGGNKKISRVSSGWLLDTPVYQLADAQGITLANAVTGQPISLIRPGPRAWPKPYTGPGTLKAPRLLEWSGEVRDHEGRLWRVDTDDTQDTTVYLSAQTGEVLYHRNKTWRLFDVFWMLHIMDYTGRKNFNNPLVVTAAIGGLWLALTGIWLLFASFHWSEFVPRRWRPTRELSVFGPDGARLRTVRASAGDNVYVSLAREGVQLPSNCGGGQSCGLCEVLSRGAAPKATAADRAHLGASKVKMGYRLACNLAVTEDTDVEVAGGASLWTEYAATVEQVTAVTPFLREIVLKPDEAAGPEYQPGAYLQVHVPDYDVPVHKLVRPEHHHQDWAGVDLAGKAGQS